MFVSTIIPTVGRPTLARAVESVLQQHLPGDEFEIIVVNDSGTGLPVEPWQQSTRVRILDTERRERSTARNTGAAVARGRYLHFLDDDDVLLPGAFAAFRTLAAQQPAAAWLVGAWRTVDLHGVTIGEFHPRIGRDVFARLVAGEGLPLQASLLATSHFVLAGTFDPRPVFTGVEDRELGRRLARTGDVAYVDRLVAIVRVGQTGSTTDWAAIAERDRIGRERILDEPGTVGRLRVSAASGFWRGRLARAYAGSAYWNLRERRLLVAWSRTWDGLRLSYPYALAPSFWRGTMAALGEDT